MFAHAHDDLAVVQSRKPGSLAVVFSKVIDFVCITVLLIRHIELCRLQYKIDLLGFLKSVLVMYEFEVLAFPCFAQLPPHKAYKYKVRKMSLFASLLHESQFP